MRKVRYLALILVMFFITGLSGCSVLDSALVKLNLRNDDFNYITQSNVSKIVIQNARDSGFRFIINDTNAIKDIYKVLSKGKVKSEKTDLNPDYIFEVYVGEEVKSYNYVVSVDERGVGNFYDDNNVYLISKDLEDTIMNNLSTIRKPKNFEDIYYDTILEVLKLKKDQLTTSGNSVGVNISGDVDCLKYMFSVDLKSFESEMNKVVPGSQLIENNASEFKTVITVKNRGYSTKVFKTTIVVDDKENKSYETYYVQGEYEYKSWKITVSDPNTKPDNW